MKNKAYIFIGGVIVYLVVIFLASCSTLKTASVKTSNTTTIKNDTTTSNDTTHLSIRGETQYQEHDEKDSTVGIAGNTISLVLPKVNLQLDTNLRIGSTDLHVYYDYSGREHIDCKEDSLTVVVARMIRDSVNTSRFLDSLSSIKQKTVFNSTDSTRSLTTIVKEEHDGWLKRAYEGCKNFLAIIGLICSLFFIFKLAKKFWV